MPRSYINPEHERLLLSILVRNNNKPMRYQVLGEVARGTLTDLTNTKVYSLAVYTEGDEKCHYSLHYTDSIWSITGGAEDDEGSVNWGIYYNGSSWVQATTGYIKVDLWK